MKLLTVAEAGVISGGHPGHGPLCCLPGGCFTGGALGMALLATGAYFGFKPWAMYSLGAAGVGIAALYIGYHVMYPEADEHCHEDNHNEGLPT